MVNWIVRVDRYLQVKADGRRHINIFCTKCGAEMTELEFNRIDTGNIFIWECFRKCPECGTKIERNNH